MNLRFVGINTDIIPSAGARSNRPRALEDAGALANASPRALTARPFCSSFDQAMQKIEERHAAEDDYGDHGVFLFLVIDFGDQVAGGDIECDAR